MNRLPGYDVGTRRSELAVFGIIGAAGVMVLGLAVGQAVRFAEGRDRIVAGLTQPFGQPTEVAAKHPAPPALTNASFHRNVPPCAGRPSAVLPPLPFKGVAADVSRR